MIIYLIGYMGSGKTTLGKELANMLGHTFIDLDDRIEQEHRCSIPKIFEQYGEVKFREWEAEELSRLSSLENLVVATGGGTPCHFRNMEIMCSTGITIYLRLSVEEIATRLARSQGKRPLVNGLTGIELKEFIMRQLTAREKYYLHALHVIESDRIGAKEIYSMLKS